MVDDGDLSQLITSARQRMTKRNFDQTAELTLIFKDIDAKKGFNINEIISLPYVPSILATICVVGSGDLATRARKSGIDKIIEPEELSRLGTNRREARKIVRSHDFFLADTSLMSNVGRSLGQFLGPKGKMPTPLPYGAPVETISARLRGSVRVRTKNQLNVSGKIGDEKMNDTQLSANANAIINEIEKKLPQGDKNIRNVIVKFTMGKIARLSAVKDQRGVE
jgi:large subunit ribosomal protein L1